MATTAKKKTKNYVPAPLPQNEPERLEALRALDILDTDDEADYDNIVALAKSIFNVPVALISLVDENRQWFKSCYGLDIRETPRNVAFCAYAILGDETLIVRDASKDAIFSSNPLVTEGPEIRFYAGALLVAPTGHKLGTLCVIDKVARPEFSEEDALKLTRMANIVSNLLLAKRDRNVAAARSEAKTDFLSHMSHELRTPLSAVIGISSLLRKKTGFDAKTEDMVRTLHLASESLLELINSVLDFSSIEARNFVLTKERFSFDQLFDEIICIMNAKANDKGLTFKVDVAAVSGKFYEGDKLRIKQILINLLGNAIKFTDSGTITLKAAYDASMLEFQVIDTGIGIAKVKLDKIFERFVQAHADTKKHQGTGLGLAITKQLAEKMGGTISVKSQEGVGSIFSVKLPDHSSQKPARSKEEVKKINVEHVRASRNYRVLLAEDYPSNVIVATFMLQEFGYDYDVAQSGIEVLDKLEQNHYDLILMDINMPHMDGIAATQQIRKNEKFAALPIIGMSAHVFDKERQECFAAGMNDYITKPVDSNELYRKIRKLIDQQPTEAARSFA